MATYDVVVSNLGTVHSGEHHLEAFKTYRAYVKDSQATFGRASGEDVTLYENGEPVQEYVGRYSRSNT